MPFKNSHTHSPILTVKRTAPPWALLAFWQIKKHIQWPAPSPLSEPHWQGDNTLVSFLFPLYSCWALFAHPCPVSLKHMFPAKVMPEKAPCNFGNVRAYQHMDTLKHGGCASDMNTCPAHPFLIRSGMGHTEGAHLGVRLRLLQYKRFMFLFFLWSLLRHLMPKNRHKLP